VAQAEGLASYIEVVEGFQPSTDWLQGGSIIEREGMSLNRVTDALWEATIMGEWTEDGPTPLVAAMRCYVGSKLGNEVEIPEALIEVCHE
jgi:hypothetical protein